MSKELKYCLVPDEFIIKHKILGILSQKFYENVNKPYCQDEHGVSVKSICHNLGLDDKVIRDNIISLVESKYAVYFSQALW